MLRIRTIMDPHKHIYTPQAFLASSTVLSLFSVALIIDLLSTYSISHHSCFVTYDQSFFFPRLLLPRKYVSLPLNNNLLSHSLAITCGCPHTLSCHDWPPTQHNSSRLSDNLAITRGETDPHEQQHRQQRHQHQRLSRQPLPLQRRRAHSLTAHFPSPCPPFHGRT